MSTKIVQTSGITKEIRSFLFIPECSLSNQESKYKFYRLGMTIATSLKA